MLFEDACVTNAIKGKVRARRCLWPAAFTLIELLVTLGVIGILASLLLPALGFARRKADSARCISNLRQLGIALRLYADENGGRLPSAQAFRLSRSNAEGGLPLIEQVLAGHVNGVSNAFSCRADKDGIFGREGSSYEWNASLNGRMLHRIGHGYSNEKGRRVFLLRDREGWHQRGRKNAVFADGSAGPESL